jgi:hypothetical protein
MTSRAVTVPRAELAACDHHTVARYVQMRAAGRSPEQRRYRERVIDTYLPKIEELVVRRTRQRTWGYPPMAVDGTSTAMSQVAVSAGCCCGIGSFLRSPSRRADECRGSDNVDQRMWTLSQPRQSQAADVGLDGGLVVAVGFIGLVVRV